MARLTLHPDETAGTIDPRLYGSFIEHLGRAVYGGIYEPGHPEADAKGFRRDVLALVKELQVPVVRYPGGNFVSGYCWEDGVGPERPRRLDPAWRTIETNAFGTNEFIEWCRAAGTEPMMAVNLGTRGMQEARELLEYCNIPGGTELSDRRRSHGYAEPHGIKMWCLGNEMDGPWQMGHKTADEYGRLACETGRLMKMIDPSIELVACGSSGPWMETFPAWDTTVLEHTYEIADYLSLHLYLGPGLDKEGRRTKGWLDYMAEPAKMDRQIETVITECNRIQAKLGAKKAMMLSFDEWNIWWHSNTPGWPKPPEWAVAPPQLEDNYTHEDALVFGGMLLSLIRHADRVRVACLAQLVNVIAPILTQTGGPSWRQTIFWPFLHGVRHGQGEALRISVESEIVEGRECGPLPLLDAAATKQDGTLTIFAINRAEREALPLEADLRMLAPGARVIEHLVMESADGQARNTRENPEAVKPHAGGDAVLRDGALSARLAPASWNVIRIAS